MKYKDHITTIVNTVNEGDHLRVVLGLTPGAERAMADIKRMGEHWLTVRDKPLATVRQTFYCIWIGFTAPLLVTKTGREYNAMMRMAMKMEGR